MAKKEKVLIPQVEREAVATPDDVKKVFALSDEQIAALKLEQDRLLKTFRSRARLSRQERQKAHAIEMERHHKKTGNVNALAEALAGQGRFTEAAQTATREDLKTIFTDKALAVEKDDADCECPTYYESGEYHLPNQYVESYAFSEKHQAIMPFIRCRSCGTLNARPILHHLAEQQAVRHAAKETDKVSDFFLSPR
jgi:hypothetical protein